MSSDPSELQTYTQGLYRNRSQPRGKDEETHPSRGPRIGYRRQRDRATQKEAAQGKAKLTGMTQTTQWKVQPSGMTQAAVSSSFVIRSNDLQKTLGVAVYPGAQTSSGNHMASENGVGPQLHDFPSLSSPKDTISLDVLKNNTSEDTHMISKPLDQEPLNRTQNGTKPLK
ncbi:unnamed protein product, partial [Ilex paraguariensis]